MVALFLRSELKSKRWSNSIQEALTQRALPTTLLESPDTDNKEENERRAELLGVVRGYRRDSDLFQGFPSDVIWHDVELAPEDLQRMSYIDYSYWNKLSNGTRKPMDAAESIRRGVTFFDVSNQPIIELAEAVRNGATVDPIILVATELTAPPVILEGHCRMTAFALAWPQVPRSFAGLLGVSSGFAEF
jgi:hypothetical protein